jgi:hypothetical protein
MESSGYYYLKIADNNAYIDLLSNLLDSIERTYGLENVVKPNPSKVSLNRYRVEPPPSHVGSHVTISSNIHKSLLGQTYKFSLDVDRGIATYHDSRMGTKASGFDHKFHPYSWYVIYVDGLPSELLHGYRERPHISIGNLGWRP